jgi:superoxide dismutase, Cu-Zn family
MRSLILMSLAVAGCTTPATKSLAPPDVTAALRTVDGTDRGQAALRLADGRMRLTVEAAGLAPGVHGVHIHDVGKCEAPDFASAKAHWNPAMKMHGRDNPMGAHSGDLPNLMIGTDGRGTLSIDVPGTMAQLLDADGAAVIIHADADDYKTDPSGNSGKRLACGVLSAP